MDAEIYQFNRCKVTWKEETQDGDQEIPDEKGNAKTLNNTTDGAYGEANQNDVSSYVTDSNEQQTDVTTNVESEKDVGDILSIQTTTETPDDSKSVKIEAGHI